MRPSTVCAYLSTTYGRHDGAAGRPRRGATLTASSIGSPSSGTPAGATCPSRASLAWRYSAFRMCGDVRRDGLLDVDSGTRERLHLARVVREQPNRMDTEEAETARGCVVRACVRGKAEVNVGVDRVRAILLKHVRAQFVDQPDPASLVVGCRRGRRALPRQSRVRFSKLGATSRSEATSSASPVMQAEWSRVRDRASVADLPRTSARYTAPDANSNARSSNSPKAVPSGSVATSRGDTRRYFSGVRSDLRTGSRQTRFGSSRHV